MSNSNVAPEPIDAHPPEKRVNDVDVARQHGRDFIGIELNPEFCALPRKRIAACAPTLKEAA